MQTKANSAKRAAAGMVLSAVLALSIVALPPAKVAASDFAAPRAGFLGTLQLIGTQVYASTAQFTRDMRSLYSVYQLQATPDFTVSKETIQNIPFFDSDEGRLIACELFQAPPPPKKKCRT